MNRISTNIFSNWGLLGLQFLASMILAPVYVHYLRLDLLGIMQMIGGITTQFVLLDLGFGTTLTRFVANAKAKKNYSEIYTILFTGLAIYGTIALLTLAIGFVIYFFLDDMVKVPVAMTGTMRYFFALSIITTALGFVLFPFLGILRGFQKYYEQNVVKMVRLITTAVLTWVILKQGYGVIALGYLNLFAQITVMPVFMYMTWRLLRHTKVTRCFRKSLVKDLSQYGMYVFLAVIAQRLFDHFDTIVIGVFISASAVPVYKYGFQLLFSVRRLTAAISSVLLPVISEYNAREAHDEIYKLFILGSKVIILISLPIIITMLVIGKDFFLLWLGPDFARSHMIFAILALPNIFLFSQRIGVPILYGTGKHKNWAIFQFFNALFNLGLSILLLKILSEPLYGVALGTAIPATIYLLYLQYLFRKKLDFNMRHYYRRVYIPFLIPTGGLIAFLLLARLIFGTLSWSTLALTATVAGCFFVVSSFWLSFTAGEKITLGTQIPFISRFVRKETVN